MSHCHGPPKLVGDMEQLILLRLILNYPGIYLSELQAKLFIKSRTCINHYAEHPYLWDACIKSFVGLLCNAVMNKRDKFMAEVSLYDPSMLLWIDESGCDLHNCKRNCGYSLRGMTPQDHRLLIRGTRYSAIPVMSIDGIHDLYLAEGNVKWREIQSLR